MLRTVWKQSVTIRNARVKRRANTNIKQTFRLKLMEISLYRFRGDKRNYQSAENRAQITEFRMQKRDEEEAPPSVLFFSNKPDAVSRFRQRYLLFSIQWRNQIIINTFYLIVPLFMLYYV